MEEKQIVDGPDNFNYIQKCGSGSFGEVWLVQPKNINNAPKIILKILKKDYEGNWRTELSGVSAFLKLLRATPSEKRPFLLDIRHIDACKEKHYCYYTMDAADNAGTHACYVPDTLAFRLTKGAMPLSESLPVAERIFKAISFLHQHGRVHRDIKPDNIIFIHKEAVLADVSLMADASTEEARIGNNAFCPPEYRSGNWDGRKIDFKACDLYAFGILLYCMATGEGPENFPCYRDGELKPTKQDKAQFNRTFDNLWRSLTADKPNDRPQAEEIRQTLAKLRKQQIQQAQPWYRRPRLFCLASATFVGILACFAFLFHFGSHHYTSLLEAVAANDISGVKYRLARKDRIDEGAASGLTPLGIALATPGIPPEIVQLLMANGACKIYSDSPCTPLEYAISHFQPLEIIEEILWRTEHLEQITPEGGGNILHLAVQCGTPEIVSALLKKLPVTSLKAIDNAGYSVLMRAMEAEKEEIALLLLRYVHEKQVSLQGSKALQVLPPKATQLCQALLDAGLTPDLASTQNATPLLLAIRRNACLELIRLLLEANANPNLQDSWGNAPIHEAVALGREDLAELLLRHGARLEQQDGRGFTPLHIAVLYRRDKLCQSLLQQRPELAGIADNAGRTPLHWAALLGEESLARLFLLAIPSLTDKLGFAPGDLAFITNHTWDFLPCTAEAGKLQSYRDLFGLDAFTQYHPVLSQLDRQKLCHLLSQGNKDFTQSDLQKEIVYLLDAKPDLSPRPGEPDILRLALRTQNNFIIPRVLECHPPVDQPDEQGQTPLMEVAQSDNATAAALLCYYAVNLDAKDNQNRGWLQIAARAKATDVLYFAGATCLAETYLQEQIATPDSLSKVFSHHPDWQTFEQIRSREKIRNAKDFALWKFRKQNCAALERTIRKGFASPNLELANGEYALLYPELISSTLSPEIYRVLLRNGAQLNLQSIQGLTPFQAALTQPANYQLLRLLLDFGACPPAQVSPPFLQRLCNFYAGIPD